MCFIVAERLGDKCEPPFFSRGVMQFPALSLSHFQEFMERSVGKHRRMRFSVHTGFHPITIDLRGTIENDRDTSLNYSTLPLSFGTKFDFIFIDGRRRMECAFIASLLCHRETIVVLHDYRRARYQPIVTLFKIVEDGPQFRVMRLRSNLLIPNKLRNIPQRFINPHSTTSV